MNTRESAIVIFLAITVGTLDCSSADRIAPAPTPLPLDETKAVGLSTDIRLVDVFGDVAVGIADGDLWLVNVRIGDSRQLTDDGHPKHDVALSGDYVAWIDQRSMIPLPGYSVPVFSRDVFVRNRHTGEEGRITDTPASRHGLRISGYRLVWQDNRNGLLADRRRDYDIYAYDLERDLEIPVAVAPGRQLMPVIHGDMVVWSDNRNSPARGTSKAGCTNCSDNRFDVYSYNLATAEEKPLLEPGGHNGRPSIYGELVTWQQFQERGESDILLLNLGTGEQEVIGAGGRRESRPLISQDYVIWTVGETCDVGGLPQSKVPTGVYAYGLKTRETRQLSYDTGPNALLDGAMALVTEGCHWITRQYAVPLD